MVVVDGLVGGLVNFGGSFITYYYYEIHSTFSFLLPSVPPLLLQSRFLFHAFAFAPSPPKPHCLFRAFIMTSAHLYFL